MPVAAENDVITLGAVLSLTGAAAHWGIAARNGAQMAVDEINRTDGVSGRALALMVEDDRSQPAEGLAAFNRILATANPAVMLGAVTSSVTLAIAPLAQARQTVLISPSATSPKVTEAGDFIFRVTPSGSLRGKIFAEHIYNDRGMRALAALYIDNEGGIGGANAFRSRFTELGGSIVVEETYPQGATDLREQLARIKAAGPDGVLVGSYPPDTVVVLKQACELALQQPLFFTTESPQSTDVLRDADAAANGAVYILAARATGNAPERFNRAYEAEFKQKSQIFAAEGYDAMRLIAEAIKVTGPTLSGQRISDFLRSVKNYSGASGAITFDENGDVSKPYAIMMIKAGKPTTIAVK